MDKRKASHQNQQENSDKQKSWDSQYFLSMIDNVTAFLKANGAATLDQKKRKILAEAAKKFLAHLEIHRECVKAKEDFEKLRRELELIEKQKKKRREEYKTLLSKLRAEHEKLKILKNKIQVME